MKKIIISLLSALFFLCIPEVTNAQSWMNEQYFANQPDKSGFHNVQDAFNKWAANKELNKIKGWKPFKRWEWFYEARTYPSGQMPSPSIYWKETYALKRNLSFNKVNNDNWTSLSPAVVPPSPDTNSIHGMGRINCITFHPADSNIFWVGASQGGVWKTTDGGQSYIPLTDNLPMLRISDIAVDPYSPDTMYISTGDIDYIGFNTIGAGRVYQFGMGVLKSTDGGITWDTTGLSFNPSDGESTLIRRVIINPLNTQELVAAGVQGVFRSSDGGDTWTQTDNNMIIDIEANPLNFNTLYAASFYNYSVLTSNAKILKSYDFGNTWTELNTGIPPKNAVQRIELAIAPSDTGYVYALACGMNEGFYALYKSTDAGANWTQAASTSGANKAPNMLGWADGGYFGISLPGFPVDDAGQGTYDLVLMVNPFDKDLIYAGGVNLWGNKTGGTGGTGHTWNVISFWLGYFGKSIHADQHCISYNPVNKKYYVGNDGGLFVTDTIKIGNLNMVLPCIDMVNQSITPGCYNLPTKWTDLSSGLHITEYYRLACSRSDGNVIIAGSQDNGTYLYKGSNWLNTWGGDGMEAMVDHNNPDILYATNYSGALNKSVDGGLSYTSSLEAPITNAGETGDWVTPFVMHPSKTNIIYTGFKNIWRSDDGGTTWNKISSFSTGLPPFKTLAVAPSDVSYIYASRKNDIVATTDEGTSWTSIAANLPVAQAMITYIAVDFFDPRKVYVTFSGYAAGQKVFRSADAGNTWENISYNLPNLPANCIVHQAGHNAAGDTLNGLYVGTDIGVFYTNDSMLMSAVQWIPYQNGLPNVVVNELEIHYGTQKLRAATYGRGLWETPLFDDSFGLNLGTKNISESGNILNIYPNPVSEKVNINFITEKETRVNVSIFNAAGSKIISDDYMANGNHTKTFSTAGLAPGIYLVQIKAGSTYYGRKIIRVSQ